MNRFGPTRLPRILFLLLLAGMGLAALNVPAQTNTAGGLAPFRLTLDGGNQPQDVDAGIRILFTITLLSLAPSFILLTTCFTRIVIVLSFVRTALQLINRFLAEDDFDADTQFCLHWFEQHGWNEGAFGSADTLARGKGTSVDGIKEAGLIQSGGGKVRLFKWAEYPTDWDPHTDKRTPVWEALHQLIRALKQGGESASGVLLVALGGKAEAVRQLAYRLYTLCERLGQAEDARAYNELITSWTGIETAAAIAPKPADGLLPGFE